MKKADEFSFDVFRQNAITSSTSRVMKCNSDANHTTYCLTHSTSGCCKGTFLYSVNGYAYLAVCGDSYECFPGYHGTAAGTPWRTINDKIWRNLSPQDWIDLLSSIELVSNKMEFLLEFGQEKMMLTNTLLHMRTRYGKKASMHPGLSLLEQDYVKALTDPNMEKGRKEAIMNIEIPTQLSDPNHWGYIIYKYVSLPPIKSLRNKK